MIDINKLRRLTQAATPGPWEVYGLDQNGQAIIRGEHIEIATCWHHCVGSIEKEMHANAAFIAAANPATINEILDRLEAAEKAVTEAYRRGYATGREEIEMERAALRAKIEQMERQEPVGVLHVGSYYGEELQDWEFEADQRVCDRLNERHVTNPTSLKLYALPGAKGE